MHENGTQMNAWATMTVVITAACIVLVFAVPAVAELKQLKRVSEEHHLSTKDRRSTEQLLIKASGPDSIELKVFMFCDRVWSSLHGKTLGEDQAQLKVYEY